MVLPLVCSPSLLSSLRALINKATPSEEQSVNMGSRFQPWLWWGQLVGWTLNQSSPPIHSIKQLPTPLSECIQHINFSKALKEIKKCPNISHGNNSLDDFLPKLQYASGTLIRKQAFMKGEDEVKVINPGRFLRLTAGDRCRLQIWVTSNGFCKRELLGDTPHH